MTEISVVVPARDAEHLLPGLLDALRAQRLDVAHEVVVVDNGSRDGTGEVAERSGLCAHVIRRSRGEGPGEARNAGVAAARGRVIAFTDADCRPLPDWLAAGLGAAEHADIVQGAVWPEPDVRPGPFDRTMSVPKDDGLYATANLFVRREAFRRAGGFTDPPRRARLEGRPFAEDTWFAWRAKRAGARTSFEATAVVHHAVLPGDARSYVRERLRRVGFPGLVAEVPELRQVFCHRRYFLSRRSAAFDLAAAGAALAVLSRRRTGGVVAGAAAVPYARLLLADARGWGPRRAPAIAAVRVLADAVSAAALVRGSAAARTPLL
ncbi:MAG: glycosyltransferase family 2 protein [Actinobacteria bacterium]|nr:glycosyltransferase family 2 protein [Actinomycetota bacterium]